MLFCSPLHVVALRIYLVAQFIIPVVAWLFSSKYLTACVVPCSNVAAAKLNRHFEELLCNFEFKKEHYAALKNLLVAAFEEKFKDNLENGKLTKRRVGELKNLQEKVEEKYINDLINREQFERLTEKYQGELSGLNTEANKMDDISSDLGNLVSKGLALAENISKIWGSGDFENK